MISAADVFAAIAIASFVGLIAAIASIKRKR